MGSQSQTGMSDFHFHFSPKDLRAENYPADPIVWRISGGEIVPLGVHGKPQWARHNADPMGLATASVLQTHTPFEKHPWHTGPGDGCRNHVTMQHMRNPGAGSCETQQVIRSGGPRSCPL